MMNNIPQGKYFDVHIEGNRYWITTSNQKPKSGYALETLKKIEQVLSSKDMEHIQNRNDPYKDLKKDEMVKVFQDKAIDIAEKHKSKAKDALLGRIFNDIKAIKAIN